MKKVRSNALWTKLSVEQRATLDKWLFEEKLGYAAAWPRAQRELGFKGSIGSLYRYYRRRDKERVMTEFRDLREELVALAQAPGDVNSLRAGSLKLIAGFLFRRLQDSPDEVEKWAPVANLMLQDDRTEMLREAKAREHEIRQDAMAFAKEKFQFDIMEKALMALPELKQLADAKKDPNTKRYEQYAQWNLLRRKMFGVGLEVHPESAQEEAEMLAAKREREGRQGQEPASADEKITEAQPPGPSSRYYQEYMEAKKRRESGNV